MGCCFSSNTRVNSISTIAEKYPETDDFEGPVKDRTCTDIVFLILFFIYLSFLFVGVTVAFVRGDPRRLVYGVDNYGNLCGIKNKPIDGADQSGKDYSGLKYLKVNDRCSGGDCSTKECVKECPEGFEKTTLLRCMPTTVVEVSDSLLQSTLPYLEEVGSDISLCWREIILLCFISIGFSVLLLVIFRFFATIIIWGVLVLVSITAIAATIYIWVMWYQKKQDLAEYEGPSKELKETQVKNWLIAAIIITIFTVIFLLIVLFLRKRIKLAAALFQEAGKSVAAMPLILLQPVWTFISLVAICCFLLVGFVCLQTSGTPLVDASGKVTFPIDMFFQVMRWLSLFGFLWLSQYIFACQNLVVAGAVSIWYFTRDKDKLSSPICRSFYVLLKYHLGSAAFGSLIIAIIKAIRAFFKFVEKQMNSQNQQCNIFWRICQCCLSCFESYLKFLNKNAYIMIMIYGDSFCTSARRAFTTVMSNALRVAAVDGIGSFVLFIGKVGITVAVGFIALEIFKPIEGLHYIWIPTALVTIFAFLCAHCFLSVYEMIIETLLLCFCEDCQMNDGITRPYFMNKSLMVFVENSRRSARIKQISR